MNHRELIEQARAETQAQQVAQIQQRRRDRPVALTPTYTRRDRVTGLRQLQSADGGVLYAQYVSNTQPQALVGFPSTPGLPGFVTQKPT